jgi:hydrogenase/urease accessory protein HupE
MKGKVIMVVAFGLFVILAIQQPTAAATAVRGVWGVLDNFTVFLADLIS